MPRPLRILIAHNAPLRRTGGMSRLMGLVHDQVMLAGHSVEYFCADDLPPRFRGSFARFAFPVWVLRHAMAAKRRGMPFDIINVHEPSGAAICLLKGSAGNPLVVVTSHGVEKRAWEQLIEEASLGREKIRLRTRFTYPPTIIWQSHIALKLADHVFCLNMEDLRYLISRFRIPATKITRIHSGADNVYATASQHRDYSRAETLLFSGTWLKRKGVADLVPAVERLLETHPSLRLVVLNGGVSELELKTCFAEAIRCRIVCAQGRPEREIAEAIAAADIYVLPSLFEGTPLTLIEAMFAGMPVVTTDTCGMKDVIQDGTNGLLVPTRSPEAIVNAVERLLQSRDLRERLGRSARGSALECYTWRTVADPVRKLYEQLCSAS